MTSPPHSRGNDTGPWSSRIALIALVATSGVAVIYIPQPIQTLVAAEFSVAVSDSAAANVAVQGGYALGVFFLVSLNDRFAARSQVTVQLIATAVALTGAALAPTHELFVAMCFMAGVTATVGQILIATALRLAPPQVKARVVAILIGSFLVGLFAVRTMLGALAELVGWRGVVLGTVVIVLCLVPLSRRVVPFDRRSSPPSYGQIMRSIPRIAANTPALRVVASAHALTFAAFISIWSVSTVHALETLGLSVASAAFMGLAGLAGGVATIATASLHTRLGVRRVFIISLLSVGVGTILLIAAPGVLAPVLVGLFLISFGLSSGQVSTQSRAVASVDPAEGGRANTVYVTATFLAGAIATAIADTVYHALGYSAVAALSFAYVALAALILTGAIRSRVL